MDRNMKPIPRPLLFSDGNDVVDYLQRFGIYEPATPKRVPGYVWLAALAGLAVGLGGYLGLL